MTYRRACLGIAFAGVLGWGAPLSAQDLPRLTLDPEATTVSGLSSGAYMAVQFHVAFSQSVAGAAVIAGGPYGCAQGRLSTALGPCMAGSDGGPDPAALLDLARDAAARARIDPLEGLREDRVYLFSGTADETVAPPVVRAAEQFYRAAGLADGAVRLRSEVAAGHGFLVEEGPVACAETEAPFINACGIDQAGNLLAHLYGPLAPETAPRVEGLQRFDQSAFLTDPEAHSMAETGFVYVPEACASGARCRLHIALHGCKQGIDRLQDLYATATGYNGWAEANGIVVLYPQAVTRLFAGNPNGCWDWWGYDDPDYATRNGPQMAAIAQMATALGVPMVGPETGRAVCISHDSFNFVHWQANRAVPCGFGGLCAAGSGDPIGFWGGRATLFETAPGSLSTQDCTP